MKFDCICSVFLMTLYGYIQKVPLISSDNILQKKVFLFMKNISTDTRKTKESHKLRWKIATLAAIFLSTWRGLVLIGVTFLCRRRVSRYQWQQQLPSIHLLYIHIQCGRREHATSEAISMCSCQLWWGYIARLWILLIKKMTEVWRTECWWIQQHQRTQKKTESSYQLDHFAKWLLFHLSSCLDCLCLSIPLFPSAEPTSF